MLLSLCSLTLVLCPVQDSGPPNPPLDLAAELEKIRATHDIPAMAAITIDTQGIVAEGYAGTHTMDGDVSVTADAHFHFGSCTKAMTATLAATFIEAGDLDWSTTLAEVFPDKADAMHEAWRPVTVAQLLSHTSGASTDLNKHQALAIRVTAGLGSLPALRADVVYTLTAAPPLFEPGTKYVYSNWGYTMVGAILEHLSGESWEDLMRERLFEPLGMSSCGFGAPNKKRGSGHPSGHTAKGKSVPGTDNPATIGPAGTVHGTVRDWAKFVQLHLRGARGDKGLLLKPETFAALHATQPGTNDTYGGGWVTAQRGWSEGPILTHSGSNTVWFCATWLAPKEGFAVLVASNRGGDAGAKGTDAACGGLIVQYTQSLQD